MKKQLRKVLTLLHAEQLDGAQGFGLISTSICGKEQLQNHGALDGKVNQQKTEKNWLKHFQHRLWESNFPQQRHKNFAFLATQSSF